VFDGYLLLSLNTKGNRTNYMKLLMLLRRQMQNIHTGFQEIWPNIRV